MRMREGVDYGILIQYSVSVNTNRATGNRSTVQSKRSNRERVKVDAWKAKLFLALNVGLVCVFYFVVVVLGLGSGIVV